MTKRLTIRVDDALYNRLHTLHEIANVSVNSLVKQAVDRYVDERIALTADELQGLAAKLREYRKRDPDLKASLRAFAQAEGQASDPLEGEVVDVGSMPPHTYLQDLLCG